ncbi:DNA-processing protein DprA [Falsiporphyromonas endometrii]|uniref:DNA-processing protein DprA n=1 Tax=Falsiporphyromonas endometrii TaxID=1387297 RepID=A0ABV9K8T4_9PORP
MFDTDELACRIALTQARGVGPIIARRLLEVMGSGKAIFESRQNLCNQMKSISSRLVDSLYDSPLLAKSYKHAEWAVEHGVHCYGVDKKHYPTLLREIPDAPSLLFYLGDTTLFEKRCRILSVVGTRSMTSYGERCCRELIKELSENIPNLLIVSGLAYGVDVMAHQSSLDCNVPTIGVLAHGLNRIYPTVHRNVALQMLDNGGLVTEYLDHTNPDRYNFVSRNRIIAGLSHATLVIESSKKGGSLITAKLAMQYNRDVFAVPGRIHDLHSLGCNSIIKSHHAIPVCNAVDIIEAMNWDAIESSVNNSIMTKEMPKNPQHSMIVKYIMKNGPQQINDLSVKCNVTMSEITNILFELEFDGFVTCLPGGIYDVR